MKKIFFFLFFFLFFGSALPALAKNNVNLYFFYGDGCPHCAKEEKFLDQLESENSNIKITRYEVWNNRDNAQLLARIGKELGIDISGVPLLIVGDQAVPGYYSAETTGKKIKGLVSNYVEYGCEDVVASFVGNDPQSCVHGCDTGDTECVHDCGCSADTVTIQTNVADTVNVPFFGEVNVKNFSLPVLTFVIAAADGFNPCAMWVLLFLISLLLGMENRKRMWILGSSFIVASGAVYFLFLAAWLNLFLYIGFVLWIRLSIALVALVSGGLHLREAWRNRDGGCHVVNTDKRKRIFSKLRSYVAENSIWLALLGIIMLAAAVNLVELVCSAGLPAVYTQILAMSDLPAWQYYGYLVFYIIIFMLDDLLIFLIAMTTLQMKAVGASYSKWSGWVGGIVMLIIGILLLFKPGWLMFG